MVRRFWTGTVNGCHVGYGETYVHPQDVLWWSKGGVLHGESPPRLAFLRKVLEEWRTSTCPPSRTWQSA